MESHKIYVGNLDHLTTEKEIVEMFSQYGEIRSVKINADEGFGFVEFGTIEEAEEAIHALNGKECGGRTLKVEDARPVRHHIKSRHRK